MKIESIKDLEAILKLCRKHGVSSFTVDNVTMQVDGPEEREPKNGAADTSKEESGKLSDEDLLFWSSEQVS